MQYKYTAEAEAERLSVTILEKVQLPRSGDEHLSVVLCKARNDPDTGFAPVHPHIVWFFNAECGGFHEGIYSHDLLDAYTAFVARCQRYGAKKCAVAV